MIKSIKAPNGTNYIYTYDEIDRFKSLEILCTYDGDGPSSGEFIDNVKIEYIDFTSDLIKSKQYGISGDKYLFEYDEFDQLTKIKFKPFYSRIEQLKCEFVYDALDRLVEEIDYIYCNDIRNKIDQTISTEYAYNVKNEVISITEKRDGLLVTEKKFEYDNNGNVINESGYDYSNNLIKQYNRLDDLSIKSSQLFFADFKNQNQNVLSCFFNEQEYDEDSNQIYYTKALSSNAMNADGEFCLRVVEPEYGKFEEVTEDEPYNWLKLDENSKNLTYKFLSAQTKEHNIFKTIIFYFYVENVSLNHNKYLLSIGDKENINYLGVSINNVGKVCLRTVDMHSKERSVISSKSVKNGWNFFALNCWSIEKGSSGSPQASEYTLYINDEKLQISNSESSGYVYFSSYTLLSLGCQRLLNGEKRKFNGRLTSLIITENYNIPNILEYKDTLSRNIINRDSKYIDEELETVSANFSTTLIPNKSFSDNYINLNNTLNSLNGITPYIYTPYSTIENLVFSINKDTKRDAYNAYGSTLAYKFGLSDSGTISLRCYFDESTNGNQFIIDNYDWKTENLSIYRSSDGSLILQTGPNEDHRVSTNLQVPNNTWNIITLTWKIHTYELAELGYRLEYTIQLNDSSFSGEKELSYKYKDFTTYIGISKDSLNPLCGQIEMLFFSKEQVTTIHENNYLKDSDITNCSSEYDSFGLLKKSNISKYGKNIYTSLYNYKLNDEVTGQVRIIPDIKNLQLIFNDSQINYGYSYLNGGIIDKIHIDGRLRYSYIYDDINRLITEFNNDKNININYSYDSNGNITSKRILDNGNDQTYLFNYDSLVKDMLISVQTNDGIKHIEYDSTYSGNPSFYGTGQGENKNGIFYTWEGRRLSNLYDSDVNLAIDYTYNSKALRTSKEINGLKTSYIYDGNNLTTEISHNGEVKHFNYDHNGNLISINYNGNTYFYIRELTRNIIGLVDDEGNIVVEYDYDAFGNILSISGKLKDSLGKANPFLYKGYYYDFETSMYYCHTRYYIPKWCRWLNADDIKYLDPENINGLNLYAYCGNNPLMNVDPSGSSWRSFWRSVGQICTDTVGAFVDLSHNIANEVYDFFYFGHERGVKVGGKKGDDTKPISFFAKNTNEWWKFWEYQVGLKIQSKKHSFSYSFGVGEINLSLGSEDRSFDLQVGINKIGFGKSHIDNATTYYEQNYVRTLPTLALVLVAIYIPELLPAAGKLAFG